LGTDKPNPFPGFGTSGYLPDSIASFFRNILASSLLTTVIFSISRLAIISLILLVDALGTVFPVNKKLNRITETASMAKIQFELNFGFIILSGFFSGF
jgi:hypothetical protein